MKRVVKIFFFIIIFQAVAVTQTQLMKVGNVVQYWFDTSPPEIILTIGIEQINGEEYFKRKAYYPLIKTDYYRLSYERIEGDSLYFTLGSNKVDSLIFNFNWLPGTFIKADTVGNSIYYERIDSVKVENTYLPDDTVYYVGLFGINLTTRDTFPQLPEQKRVYKKFGLFDLGMWGYLEGVKINGTRYGTVYPFPEEISFSADSIFIPSVIDTGSVFIVNNSDYDLRIDSIISIGGFYGYRGWFTLPNSETWFYLYRNLPDEWYGTDTLGIIISPHDSIKISFYSIDLCPICYSSVQEYFIDTLRFVFTFIHNYKYSFSKSIQISGEGYPSNIESVDVYPNKFLLLQNYPNPFNPTTRVQYFIRSKQIVTIKILDILGEVIRILVDEEKPAGIHEVEFDASLLSSGIYFYQMKAGSFLQTKKMILLR